MASLARGIKSREVCSVLNKVFLDASIQMNFNEWKT